MIMLAYRFPHDLDNAINEARVRIRQRHGLREATVAQFNGRRLPDIIVNLELKSAVTAEANEILMATSAKVLSCSMSAFVIPMKKLLLAFSESILATEKMRHV